MFDLEAIQSALREFGVDCWLIGDFRGSNVLGRRVLDMEALPVGTRRFFYAIPSQGEPRKLIHRIEADALEHLPGARTIYLRWQDFEAGLRGLVGEAKRVAMEYSPRNGNPYISKVDAGTVELVRSFGAEPVASGDLIQQFEAVWDEEQWQLHLRANEVTTAAFPLAWQFIAEQVRQRGSVRETVVQSRILEHFEAHGLTTYSPPIVGAGPHSGDPHYEPLAAADAAIDRGDFVLIDLWAKLDQPRAVYSDLTRVGFVGEEVPSRYQDVFKIVAEARDAAITLVREAFAEGRPLQGFQVDDAARRVIEEAGYGEFFVHRTGHNIGQETHGNGAHIDNLETHEERLILKNTCFSIEPGIYLNDFGIRSEVNVFVDGEGQVHVTGGPLQTEVLPILA